MPDNNRDMRLLDGRRVQVKDLIDAGLVEAGAELEFVRPRLDEVYHASITEAGRLRLPDGREFAAPSRAAMEAAGLSSIDGWYAWEVKETGVSLSVLRRDLLAASEGDSSTPDSYSAHGATEVEARREMLRSAAESAESGNPQSLPVRKLLLYWDARMRGRRVVDRMLADLDNYSLMTRPDFQTVSLSSTIEMVLQPKPTDEAAPSVGGSADESAAGDDELDVGLTLGNLPSALEGVTSVNPNDSIEKAMTLMRLNDFSQLPVMTSSREVKGVVTWKSIAKALAHERAAKLTDAIEPAPVHAFDQDLVDVLSVLYDHDFLFVRDDKREISGPTLAGSSRCAW